MKRTKLFEEHLKLNAKMTEFGGWEMPVQYSSIIGEHNAVRQDVGMFDASHMGEFIVAGENAVKFLNMMTLADAGAIPVGRAKYSMLLNEKGGVIDDIIIYRRPNDFFVVVNAGNIDKDFVWLNNHIIEGVKLSNISDSLGLLAVQGPAAQKIMQLFINDDLSKMKYFSFVVPSWRAVTPEFAILARTGYTGEDGFEIFISNEALKDLWNKLIIEGVRPCGLGARDTLRLEACMPLHGHEITDDITPVEAGLDWAIFWDKEFIGKDTLLKQKKEGVKKFLVAFIMDTGIPRAGCDILFGGKNAGTVTSGTFSPTLKKGLGLGYVDKPLRFGDALTLLIHGQEKAARVVQKPFYKRKK